MTNFQDLRHVLNEGNMYLVRTGYQIPFVGQKSRWDLGTWVRQVDGKECFYKFGEIERKGLGRPVIRAYNSPVVNALREQTSPYAALEIVDGRPNYVYHKEPRAKNKMAIAEPANA